MNQNPLIQKAVSRIPSQLHREEFRFVPIWAGSKRPFEPKWNVEGGNNYRYDDPKLAAYLLEGHNWGTCTGMGNLIIFDSDNEIRLKELGISDALPDTFIVRTGGGGLHRYYICPDAGDKIIMFDLCLKDQDHPDKPMHLGEVQTMGFQGVGAGSLHPNGLRYKVESDLPIAEVAWSTIYNVLEGKVEFSLAEEKEEVSKVIRVKRPGERDPFEDVNIEDILYPVGNVKRHGSTIKGAHPIHGSEGGQNFQIDTAKNTFFCYRCWKGGGPALAIAIKEGLLRCDEAGKGVLRGEKYLELLKIARQRGYIEPVFKSSVERVL
jgi:hypothetical protein